MIDEIVCYIEEPPKIDCEIQQAKIEWQNEYYPYKGKIQFDAIQIKDSITLETKQRYLDDNIVIVGHGLEQYNDQTYPRDPETGQIVIQPDKTTKIIDVTNKHFRFDSANGTCDTNIVILPGDHDIYKDRFEFTSNTQKDQTIKTKDLVLKENITIKKNAIEYTGGEGVTGPHTIYII